MLLYAPRPDADYLATVRRVLEARHAAGFTQRRQRIEYLPLETALAQADFVSLHVPLTRPGESNEPTFHLIDEGRAAEGRHRLSRDFFANEAA